MGDALSQYAAMSFPEFQRYLANEYVSRTKGRSLDPRTASDYASRLRRLEEVTRWQVEGAHPDILLAFVDRIRDDRALADKLGPGGDSDIQVALRRYAEYLSRPTPTVEGPRAGRRQSRTPRAFNPAQAISPFVLSEEHEDPEETLVRREKATQEHRAVLVALYQRLVRAGWTDIQEIANSVDLWATNPADGRRFIFEAKTLNAGTEVSQTRSALAQLLEYRHFDGSGEDRLCLVTNAPISDARERLLRALDVAVLALGGMGFQAVGPLAQEWFAPLIGAAPGNKEEVES